MIIFTVTSNITGQVYVGSTRNELESQWEKMVAAAQQDLDYPLYREIRVNGEDAFTVDEWDRAEDRQELLELEQEAIDHFGAKSLRGYKTSTVKILPKKKTRQRKSSIEKELAAIFSREGSDSETPPSLTIKSSDSKSTATASPSKAAPTSSKPTAPKPVNKQEITKESIKAALAKIAEEEKAKEAAEAAKKAAPIQTTAGSQANATVQMNSISLSDDISAQLAAITAAADAVLSGDSQAAENLQQMPEAEPESTAIESTAIEEEIVAAPQPVVEEISPEPEQIVKPVCPKELRIIEAIERHRNQRARKTQEAIEQERNNLAGLLAELDARAKNMDTGALAAAA
ncbi:GIY-YIG nuclease family protein [Endozoicomonas gorgoniicola]|uniref:GIY-YIG nuclease family protein n=1 Tax=Endozoicomonas gorgoniicola TaxID=1234144 RepID=A0ABT3N466_9GAMM|nr:GIY-YIG nuclease family protein [Endozoicomonas gorgoniicola]MCW7556422.1 GIY-YIG nuclease family protein [Endozoicomonas gorgoniicola]